MAEIKKISTELQLLDKFLDTSGDAGTSGQVLTSTGTGINWVSAGTPGTGVYLPLAGGTMTGDIQMSEHSVKFDQSGTRSWDISAGSGNLNITSGDSGGLVFLSPGISVEDNAFIGGYVNVTGSGTFAGDVLVEDNLYLTDAGTVRGKIQLNSSDRDDLDIKAVSLGSNMKFFTVDTERMRINSSGNVGIGNTININKLDVSGNINIQGGNGGYLTFNNGDANIVINNNGTGRDLSFKTYSGSSNAERMRIDKDGNVAIGRTSASKRLDINLLAASGEGASMILRNTAAGSGAYNRIYFAPTASDPNTRSAIIEGQNVDGNNNMALIFKTSAGTNPTEKMRISQTGAIKFNTYGAGTLVSDTSGNITVSSGGGAGGPYLPLTAGSTKPLTGDLYIEEDSLYLLNASSNYWRVQNNSSGKLVFKQGTTQRGIWSSGELQLANNLIVDGNVGIGTTSPGTALQVGGLDDGSNYDITVGWNAVSSQAVGTKRSALTFKTSQTGVNNEDIYKWDIAMVTAPATASSEPFGSDLAFLRSTRSSTSVDETTMILTQLGNVGIGTTSPNAELEVTGATPTGSTGYGDNANSGQLYITSNAGVGSQLGGRIAFGGIAGNGGGAFSGTRQDSVYGTIEGYKASATANHAGGGLSFKTNFNNTGALIERMNINQAGTVVIGGNVGIGTTTPVEKLTVFGQVASTSSNSTSSTVGANRTIMDLTGGGARMGHFRGATAAGSGFLRLFTDSVERMRINSAGNVGIGTDSPDAKLSIKRASNAINTELSFIDGGGTRAAVIGMEGATTNDMLLSTLGGIRFYTTSNVAVGSVPSNERMRITSGGNVGIGTTSPNSKLDVRQAVDGIALELHNTGGNVDDFVDIKMIAGNTTSGTLGTILRHQRDGSGGGDFSILTNPTLTGTPTEKLIVKSGGNVGIGTTNPTNKLHIQGSQATVYSSTDTGGQASAGTTINNTNTSGNTNNFSQLLFTVGTNNNSVSRIVAIRSGSDASDLAFVGKSTAGVAEYMRIKSGGNVGIGINNPSALLEVRKGSISGQIAKFSAINPHVVIESTTAGNAVLHLKPNATGSKSGQFKVTAGNGYNFLWSNDASGTGEIAYMDLDTSTTGGGDLTVKGDVIAYGSPSDKKYKENIKPIESALDKAMQLQGVTFDWKDSESILEIKEDIGFIAQDVQEVLPELVRDNGKGNLSLRYQGITPILLEAIKELKAEIEELKLNNCNCNK